MVSRTSGDVDGTESSYRRFAGASLRGLGDHHRALPRSSPLRSRGIETELIIGQSGDARRLVRPLCFVTGISPPR